MPCRRVVATVTVAGELLRVSARRHRRGWLATLDAPVAKLAGRQGLAGVGSNDSEAIANLAESLVLAAGRTKAASRVRA